GFSPPVPVHRRLPNGLGVTLVEKRGLPIVTFALLLNAGATTDPADQPGLASFTTQMMAEGTEHHTSQELANAFEFIGARLSTETRREVTMLSTETLTKHWTRALELVAEVAQHPTFPEHELERIRREHLTDLRRAKDDPTFVADQIMPGLIFGPQSPYGHPSLGTEDSVAAFSREDLVRQFQQFYGPAAATLVVVGDVSLEEVLQQAEAAFGNWNTRVPEHAAETAAGPGTELDPTTIYLVDKPGAAQSVIRAGHTTVPRQHEDYFGMTLLNFTFGGQFSARLNQNLRQDKGYSYGFHSSISWFREPSLMVAGGSVQTAVTRESVQETLNEFRDIHSARPVTDEEIAAAKAGMLLGYPAGFERSGQVLGHLVQLLIHGLPDDYFQTVTQKIEAVSLQDVQSAGSERVRPDQLKVLVVGDRQEVEPGLRELGLPLVILDSNGKPAG
ncbi:MAG: M16 family metallopeptidase, partial [Dehalococcoidia bacterium]